MQYKELMEHCKDYNFIPSNASIKAALLRMKENNIDTLILLEENKVLEILIKDNLLDAYASGLVLDSPIKQIGTQSYEIVDSNGTIKSQLFNRCPFLIVIDEEKKPIGYMTEKILFKTILKNLENKLKKEIKTKKLLHKDNENFTDKLSCTTASIIDLYNRTEKLIHINRELWDIIEYSSDSIYVTDGDGVTVYANDAFERMTGAPVKSVIGKTVFEAEEEGIYKPSISAIVLREKRPVTLIQRGINGKDLIVTGTPVYDLDGRIYMVICNSKDIDELSILKNYLINLKSSSVKSVEESNGSSRVIYTSDYMMSLMKLVNKVTQVDSTVLLTGESGTGKGLIARYIHENSNRSEEKLIELNCSAIPESLFESELFGYESGAFTGAQKGGKPGIIEMANKGTLFLDEIGDMPMHMQVKLLKVLQDRKVTRVGALEPLDIDIRIIAATNKDLKQLIEKELFRADLYYRLNVFPIHIAPLRDRKEDIYTLVQHYLLYYNKKHASNVVLTQKAQEKISNYRWPGNVRELEHFIERLVIINDGIVDENDLDMEHDTEVEKSAVHINRLMPLKEAIDETERQLVNIAMKISENSYEIADLLQISQASAYRKMKKYTR